MDLSSTGNLILAPDLWVQPLNPTLGLLGLGRRGIGGRWGVPPYSRTLSDRTKPPWLQQGGWRWRCVGLGGSWLLNLFHNFSRLLPFLPRLLLGIYPINHIVSEDGSMEFPVKIVLVLFWLRRGLLLDRFLPLDIFNRRWFSLDAALFVLL